MEEGLTLQVLRECVRTMGLKQWGLIVLPAGAGGWAVGKAVKSFQTIPFLILPSTSTARNSRRFPR